MIDIEHLEPKISFTSFEGDCYLSFKFIDIPGTVRNANISIYALKMLWDAFQEGQYALLQSLVPEGKEVGITLTVGPTRGEVYDTEVTQ